jgi:RimJ/RimL family protein N-acetyltransferase
MRSAHRRARFLAHDGQSALALQENGRILSFFEVCVEVGWRLAANYWGRGYATEGARAALAFGWAALGLREIVSFTATGNHRSRRVMERIGMVRRPEDDFDHPSLPEGHPLRRHVLCRIARPPSPGAGSPSMA